VNEDAVLFYDNARNEDEFVVMFPSDAKVRKVED
jgi:hypothetical protein